MCFIYRSKKQVFVTPREAGESNLMAGAMMQPKMIKDYLYWPDRSKLHVIIIHRPEKKWKITTRSRLDDYLHISKINFLNHTSHSISMSLFMYVGSIKTRGPS